MMIQSRRHLMVAALLIAPAGAMAQNVKLHTIAGTWQEVEAGLGDSEHNSASVIPAGTQWTIWTVLETDYPIDGFQYELQANGGADNSKFQVVDYAPGPLAEATGQPSYDGFGSVFGVGVPTLWSTSNYLKRSTPFVLGANQLIFTYLAPFAPGDITGKTVLGYVIENTVALAHGTEYGISINGSMNGAPNALWVSTGSNPSSGDLFGDDFTISVNPEPASALLLLTGVPFLRRRRV